MHQKILKTLLPLFVATLLFSVITSCDSSSNDVADPQPSLTIDNETLTFDSNTTATITATAKKADGTNDTITAVSSDVTVATVSVSDLVVTVTGIKAGTPTITITSGSGLSETCVATLNASWHTVFFDNFNRADSSNIGDDWTVIRDGMKIDGNRLYSAKPSVDVDDPGLIITSQTYSDSVMRITVKMTTSDKIVDPLHASGSDTNKSIIYARANIDAVTLSNSTFYGATIRTSDDEEDKEIYIGTMAGRLAEDTFEQTVNTTYEYEFTINGSSLTFILKDNSGIALKTLTSTDSTYTSGNVGLYGGSWDATTGAAIPVYFDDFKIEVYK